MTRIDIKNTPLWQLARDTKGKADRITFEALTKHAILPRPFRLVVFAGLKRSGNHAFINWFLSQSHGPCAFFNHVRPHQYPTERIRREFRVNRWSSMPTVAFSYEDRRLTDIFDGALQEFIARHEPQIQSRTLCLILRDPRNLMASRFRKWPEEYQDTSKADTMMALWKDYAAQALADQHPYPAFNTVPVYYNRFIADAGYRSNLAQVLDIRDGSRGLETVTTYGYGSSFSSTDTPDIKGIFERWKNYEDDPTFQRLFAEGTVTTLADKLEQTGR